MTVDNIFSMVHIEDLMCNTTDSQDTTFSLIVVSKQYRNGFDCLDIDQLNFTQLEIFIWLETWTYGEATDAN